MKTRVIRLLVIAFAMIVCAGTPVLADGGEPAPFPQCYPRPCPVK
jgi:hypothetical protein